MNLLLSLALVSALLSCITNAGQSDVECFEHMIQCVTQCAKEGILKTGCGMCVNCALTVKRTTVYPTRKQFNDFIPDITPTKPPKGLLLLSRISPVEFFRAFCQSFQYKPQLRIRALSKQSLLCRHACFKPWREIEPCRVKQKEKHRIEHFHDYQMSGRSKTIFFGNKRIRLYFHGMYVSLMVGYNCIFDEFTSRRRTNCQIVKRATFKYVHTH
ncbi:hypothetical protein CSKR_106690 [Clonorchis sinensis]|uniref:Uncharacterized protein n=1 Tax=Clonorchis sinensis TaxID=79923 RepID=A0A419Q801_CLOSI|nr:hypothetical protein CSKR_106690 [Clonorchis sinensis]